MLCANCGSPLKEGWTICKKCGASVDTTAVVSGYQTPVLPSVPLAVPSVPLAPLSTPFAQPVKAKSKAPLVISLVAAFVVVVGAIAAIAIIPGIIQENDYQNAISLMNEGDYAAARQALLEMGDYEDAAYYAEECQKHLDYEQADSVYSTGNYEGARKLFRKLALIGFLDSEERVLQCDYAIAIRLFQDGRYDEAYDAFSALALRGYLDASDRMDECTYSSANDLFETGNREEAYYLFITLGDYSDAASRAEACLSPRPGTGVLYQNESYYSTSVRVVIDASRTLLPVYIKMYSYDAYVAAIFINEGDTATIELSAGTYTIKEAYGSLWFGDDIMFGYGGRYMIMLLDDNETVYLQNWYEYTIYLNVESEGNIGSKEISPDLF